MKFIVYKVDGSPAFEANIDRDKYESLSGKRRKAVKWAIAKKADLRKVNLSCTNLSGLDFKGADLSGADFSGVEFSEADLSGADFFEADLRGADLSRADLTGANLIRSDLSGALLNGAFIAKAVLYGADLTEADLTGASFYKADLTGADLRGAFFGNTNLSGACLSEATLDDKVPVIADIHKKMYAACSEPGAFSIAVWHSACGKYHCRAGWVVTLAGQEGTNLEDLYGTEIAAALIYAKSDPCLGAVPDFLADSESALKDMERLASS